MGIATVTAMNSVSKEPSTGLVLDTLGISEGAPAFPQWRKAGKNDISGLGLTLFSN